MEKIKEKQEQVDAVIVGTGVAGLFAALHLPRDFKIMMITKSDLESSDSFLAQGGICVLRDESDYDSYFEDTMRAGHYENREESVDIMIRSSQEIIRELIGVRSWSSSGERKAEMNRSATAIFLVHMNIRERARIPVREFYFMKILPGKRLRVSC